MSFKPRHWQWRRLAGWASLAMGGIILGSVVTWLVFGNAPLVSPLTDQPRFEFFSNLTPGNQNKVVYGFLPYWNINKTSLQPELSHLAYFSLTVGPDGRFITKNDDGSEPGYQRLQSDTWLELANRARAGGTQLEIVIAQFNDATIESLLASPEAQDQMLQHLDSLLLAYPISGVNIDFEYVGDPSPRLRDRFSEFMERIRTHLDSKYQDITLSVDVYASASSNQQLWDIPRLARSIDFLVVMAYDFHRRSSVQAGPVAPLFGGKEYWDSDISGHLKKFIKMIDREKILLGVPFYGYGWQTTNRQPQAHTFPDTGFTVSFDRVQELLAQREELKLEEGWNEQALSPYLTYVEDGETYVVYFEDSRSLSYKLDFVNQLDLGGIAIWALGYEGESRELWEVIHRKFTPGL